MARRVVNVSVLHGEPTDGSGRVCIHLFVQDERGLFTEPNALHMGADRKLVGKPTRGRLACDPKRVLRPVARGGVTTVTPRTDDPRAVTCPKCEKSPEYVKIMGILTAADAGK